MFRRYNLKELPDGVTNTSFTYWDLLRTGNILTINRFVDFQSRIQYEKQLGIHWYFSFAYLFRFYHYYRYENIFPVNAGINTIEIGLKFKL